ncbi:hypothetical protein L596_005927 [Steinernema carpocapsae]|uniref:Beta-lactamase-related domain-containing protein n=1 Tax=Steinernema carpocapsae TaxID=34508 RepID=A0A4U8V0J8_STECR|nr:hypothetical protein L596_005927 [Steinernema carpocapsae]
MRLQSVIKSCSVAATVISFGSNGILEPYVHPLTPQERAAEAVNRYMVRYGIPGMSIGVSINGQKVWATGFGYSDVEQGVPCSGDTVMRIASVSKPITATIAAKLIEEGKFDIDLPVNHYLPDMPKLLHIGVEQTITSRQLLSHTSGIRHYIKSGETNEEKLSPEEREAALAEMQSTKEYPTVTDSLEMFIHDPLLVKPGSKMVYSTHGFTLLSAVIEKIADQKLPVLFQKMFKELGMNSTCLDKNECIIPYRARYYRRDKRHRLVNCPEVNNSCKWAGGGILSNVHDLLRFANVILYSFQSDDHSKPAPYLKSATMQKVWRGEQNTGREEKPLYCLGWDKADYTERYGGSDASTVRSGFWGHSGGAVGASSYLLVKPTEKTKEATASGVCVAILVNMESVAVRELALEIAEIFCENLE